MLLASRNAARVLEQAHFSVPLSLSAERRRISRRDSSRCRGPPWQPQRPTGPPPSRGVEPSTPHAIDASEACQRSGGTSDPMVTRPRYDPCAAVQAGRIAIDAGVVLGCDPYIRRQVLLEPCALLGSGDGKDVLSLNEKPGARQLGWRAVLLSRHCPDLLH